MEEILSWCMWGNLITRYLKGEIRKHDLLYCTNLLSPVSFSVALLRHHKSFCLKRLQSLRNLFCCRLSASVLPKLTQRLGKTTNIKKSHQLYRIIKYYHISTSVAGQIQSVYHLEKESAALEVQRSTLVRLWCALCICIKHLDGLRGPTLSTTQ